MKESKWGLRAARLLERALSDINRENGTFGDDAMSDTEAARDALRIAAGELPEETMDDFPFPGEESDEADCICPPDLVARGGFRSGCPVH